jgi:hypothetical protein
MNLAEEILKIRHAAYWDVRSNFSMNGDGKPFDMVCCGLTFYNHPLVDIKADIKLTVQEFDV